MDGNHPGFPQYCSGGPFPSEGVEGLGVVVNGGSRGALTTGNFYPEYDLTAKPVLGVSMYRVVTATQRETGDTFLAGFDRGTGNGNKAPDFGPDIQAAIDRVEARWDVAVCSTIVPLPGELLLELLPDGGFMEGFDYLFTNYMK